ncbi:transcriptional regulator, LysR family [Myxococcus fulvus]|uniref:LysR family transcriptional regulator n=1 Tax=Myxococcus fulvus TaxID=33 RepID=A0A511THB2_MYXFU|nr:LysR family transcriptional regulator [Myxococcus fulvus]AKF84265.1 LysR family transcriptional regulator [Myxococcus fulvus 124B02]GEN13541.1 LysR family transcriptional regulator [Myxococcus fulvus]SEU37270.1 transcriptional regulator, LysR family [Myxococcus fulvus]
MLDSVTIDQLRTLRAVAEEGSFSAAARKLGQGQPAVSQAIQRLEKQLGLRLFDRSSRVPRLTAKGEAVVAAARRLHEDLATFQSVVGRIKSGEETKLALVVDAMFPTPALLSFVRELAQTHPGVELTLEVELLSAVTERLRERKATLGIAGADLDLTGLEQRPIALLSMLPVAAPSHPLARVKGVITEEHLASATQLVLSERLPTGKAGTVDRGVLSPKQWRVADLMTKHALILGGLGWGHEPEHLVREDLSAGRLVQLRLAAWEGGPPPRRPLALVRRKGVPLGPVATWASNRLTDLCQLALSADHHAT